MNKFGRTFQGSASKTTSYTTARRMLLILVNFLILLLRRCESQTYDSTAKLYTHINGGLDALPSNLPQDVEKLYLTHNNITSVNMPYYAGLKIVKLDNNLIDTFPDVRELKSTLTHLYLANNQITFIPRALLYPLVKLQDLRLEYNLFMQFPDFRDWTGNVLKFLYIGGNPMTSVEYEDLSALTTLNNLMMPDTLLTDLPAINLPKLRKLYMHNNRLTTFPHFELSVVFLKELSFNGNQITHFNVNELLNLPNLRILYLSENPLGETISLKDVVKFLPALQTLWVQSTGLTEIPSEFFRYAPNLSWLGIGSNSLRTLPNVCYSNADPGLSVSNNDLQCDARLLPVMVGMFTMDAKGKNMFPYNVGGFECMGPAHLTSKMFREVTIDELKGSANQWNMKFELADPAVYHCDHPHVTMAIPGMRRFDCARLCLKTTDCTSFRYDYDPVTGDSVCGIGQWFRDEMTAVPAFSEIYVVK